MHIKLIETRSLFTGKKKNTRSVLEPGDRIIFYKESNTIKLIDPRGTRTIHFKDMERTDDHTDDKFSCGSMAHQAVGLITALTNLAARRIATPHDDTVIVWELYKPM